MSEETNKDIPSVGKKDQKSSFMAIVFIVAMGAIIYSFLTKSDDDKPKNEDVKYSTSGYTNDRVFNREVPKSKPKKVKETTKAKSVSRDELLAILAKQKKEQEMQMAKIEDKKRRSETNIFKRSVSNGRTKSVPVSNGAFPFSLENDDKPKDEGVLSLDSGKPVDTEYAVQLNNTSLMIGAGKFIRGVLETSIDSTLPGQVRAVVANDIYSENGSRVLIDKGSRLVGQYQSGIKQGQNRVFVIWSHVTTKTGAQISLESTGTDALGTSGLTGDYDSHFFKRFGGALLLSVIEGYSDTSNNEIAISSGSSLSNASAVALENSVNIPPTIYVDQGSTINVFIARNLNFEGVL